MSEVKAMSTAPLQPSVLELGLRWTARLLDAGLVGLVLLIYVGAGFNPFNLTATEALQHVFFLATCVGLVVAWRRPLAGGALSTGGMLLFFAVEFALTGRLPGGPVFHLMLLTGLLFLLSGLISRRKAVL
jgi:hypothetical protein